VPKALTKAVTGQSHRDVIPLLLCPELPRSSEGPLRHAVWTNLC
jgi:hypothetical protein